MVVLQDDVIDTKNEPIVDVCGLEFAENILEDVDKKSIKNSSQISFIQEDTCSSELGKNIIQDTGEMCAKDFFRNSINNTIHKNVVENQIDFKVKLS